MGQDRLKAILDEIKAALIRGGPGAARRESDQEVVRKSALGMRMAKEMQAANEADFGQHYEEWFGKPPEPSTPRLDPQHAAKARMGIRAERFLFGAKIVFWAVFGPIYFNALAWVAVAIALAISITLSLGVKPLIAGGIWKPGLTRQQNERRLHANFIAGIIAFAISFGGLFLIRGMVGPFANVGALLLLPVLSATDLVLLYLMGIAHACSQIYNWAAVFVHNHHEYSTYFGAFENEREAAKKRLGEPESQEIAATPAPVQPVPVGPGGNGASPTGGPQHVNGPVAVAMLALAFGLTFAPSVRAQAMLPPSARQPVSQDMLADLRLDSTTSLYPSIASTITPVLANSFYGWAGQAGASRMRVSKFERDGWLPRTVAQMAVNGTPAECAPRNHGEKNIFRGISEALEKDANDACMRATTAEANRIHGEMTKALASAWRAEPLPDPKQRICTAFNDALAAAGRASTGNLIAIVSDTEETCKAEMIAVPERGAGAIVIVILLPSKSDMGPGVSAAARFNAKKAHLLKIAPWLVAVLAPADVENYRLPVPVTPVIKESIKFQAKPENRTGPRGC